MHKGLGAARVLYAFSFHAIGQVMAFKVGFIATFGVAATLLLSAGVMAAPGSAMAQAHDATELHSALALTPDQEPAWQAYQQALAPNATAQGRHRSAEMLMPTLTTPRRIDLIEANMQADFDLMHRQGEATKAFYDALSPAQQRVFDTETLPAPQIQDGRPQQRP